jgi:hypothetical protein
MRIKDICVLSVPDCLYICVNNEFDDLAKFKLVIYQLKISKT